MTRTERIRKLTHAIKEYRGCYAPNTNPPRWIRSPKPTAITRVRKWLVDLGVHDLPKAVFAIESFKSYDEMHAWLNALRLPPTTHTPRHDSGCDCSACCPN